MHFAILSSRNRFAILFRVRTAKETRTQAQRIKDFVARLARGEAHVSPTEIPVRQVWLALLVAGAACRPAYQPRTRTVTVTAVPLLTKEMAAVYSFLKADFAAQGMLSGKEVYAFVPSTLVAYAGDTLEITFVNPEDDAHTFVLPDLAVALPGQSTKTVRYPVGALQGSIPSVQHGGPRR